MSLSILASDNVTVSFASLEGFFKVKLQAPRDTTIEKVKLWIANNSTTRPGAVPVSCDFGKDESTYCFGIVLKETKNFIYLKKEQLLSDLSINESNEIQLHVFAPRLSTTNIDETHEVQTMVSAWKFKGLIDGGLRTEHIDNSYSPPVPTLFAFTATGKQLNWRGASSRQEPFTEEMIDQALTASEATIPPSLQQCPSTL